MRVLSLIFALPALMVLILPGGQDDSPHGESFKISCDKCHSASGGEFDPAVYSFDHSTTALPLAGQHLSVDCKLCHPTLVFSEAPSECALCHTDMHEQTVGEDCARCHTPRSWIVTNITDIHRQGRFPLVGAHFMAGCADCHLSASSLRYEPLGIECSDCHMADYQAAKEEQGFLEGRIQELEYLLSRATIVEEHDGKRDKVEVGATVTVQEDGEPPEV